MKSKFLESLMAQLDALTPEQIAAEGNSDNLASLEGEVVGQISESAQRLATLSSILAAKTDAETDKVKHTHLKTQFEAVVKLYWAEISMEVDDPGSIMVGRGWNYVKKDSNVCSCGRDHSKDQADDGFDALLEALGGARGGVRVIKVGR